MQIETDLLRGGLFVGGAVGGFLIRGLLGMGQMKQQVQSNSDQIDEMKKDLKQQLNNINTTMKEGFKDVNSGINRINERCEHRFESCQEKRGQLERKVAAMTGKANGQ
jgi:ElaB/YqjD/DUF883 family membrane-anchored ribosome-binding protein